MQSANPENNMALGVTACVLNTRTNLIIIMLKLRNQVHWK